MIRFFYRYDFETIVIAVVMIAAFVAIFALVLVLKARSDKKFAALYREAHPETSVIRTALNHDYALKITKVDGMKTRTFRDADSGGLSGVFIPPGDHVLSLEFTSEERAIKRSPDYKRLKNSQMAVTVNEGKDYMLLYERFPGVYSLIEGKPGRS